MDLLILAGGMGSRFGGLKQIEPIHKNGEFIIDYSIYDAIKAGFDRIVFLIKEEMYEIFRETVGKRIEDKIKTEYVFQSLTDLPEGFSVPKGRDKPWGTAHAILCCKNAIKDKFVMINADDFYGRETFKIIADALKENESDNRYYGVGYKVANTLTENGAVKRGIITSNENNFLVDIEESSIEKTNGKIMATYLKGGESFELDENCLVSMNVWGFTPQIFDYIEARFKNFLLNMENPLKDEFLIPDIINEQVHNGMVDAEILNTSELWYGVTYREDKDSVVNAINSMIKNKIYPDNLWN